MLEPETLAEASPKRILEWDISAQKWRKKCAQKFGQSPKCLLNCLPGLPAVHHGHLALLDEERDVKDVLHRVGEARRVADKLVEVDRLVLAPFQICTRSLI